MLCCKTIAVTPFDQNARILWYSGSSQAVVVDPGGDIPSIISELQGQRLTCSEIWLTHSHLDHCGGVAMLKRVSGAILYAHPAEAEYRARVPELAQIYGFSPGDFEQCPEPDRAIVGGELLTIPGAPAETKVRCLFTPGHSPGHLSFHLQNEAILIAGDTLFRGSIGRTDLPGGNHGELLRSIRNELLTLADETVVWPGHGPNTTIGEERRDNPFLNDI